ncbi:MAG: class I SAM-dependent methyltransferase [Simkaniaceae bacterium]|nr:class I SAM-dependent methyltransferase [Simkaniaceae bacterium]
MFELPIIQDGEDKNSPLKNRIRKNYRQIRKWAKKTETDCFRLYDRDIKEYPFVIDFYSGRCLVQYFSFDRDSDAPCPEMVSEVEEVLASLLGVMPEQIYSRMRVKREKIEQYEKLDEQNEFFIAQEYGVKFKINLVDYLDTGLFLDHRETRQLVAKAASKKRLLNLFAYTCSFSVHAAVQGALYTKSVDLSNTYTSWGRENFLLNGISLEHHPVVRADCLKFLDEEVQSKERYDVIVIDPPTLSRSKKMDQMFDIQADYQTLLKKGMRLLSSGGVIFFSTNSRKFHLDPKCFPAWDCYEITDKTIPLDCHNQKIHRSWKITGLSR